MNIQALTAYFFPPELCKLLEQGMVLNTCIIKKGTQTEKPIPVWGYVDPLSLIHFMRNPYKNDLEILLYAQSDLARHKLFGEIVLLKRDEAVFVRGQDSHASDFKYVGSALHEIAFRLSIALGCEGRLQNESMIEALCFHYKMGMVCDEDSFNQTLASAITDFGKKPIEGENIAHQYPDSPLSEKILSKSVIPMHLSAQGIAVWNNRCGIVSDSAPNHFSVFSTRQAAAAREWTDFDSNMIASDCFDTYQLYFKNYLSTKGEALEDKQRQALETLNDCLQDVDLNSSLAEVIWAMKSDIEASFKKSDKAAVILSDLLTSESPSADVLKKDKALFDNKYVGKPKSHF